jgi:uncharacterized protein
VTATPILESLAREFSARVEHVHSALEMLDAGLSASFIGRFRRDRIGPLTESMIRRLSKYRQDLEDLDRRRGTILRLIEREPGVNASTISAIQACMDRFELEDLFIPHRRPEPEVQLALDRGLGQLADLLVAPIPKAERPQNPSNTATSAASSEEPEVDEDSDASTTSAPSSALAVTAAPEGAAELAESPIEAIAVATEEDAAAPKTSEDASDPNESAEDAAPAPVTLDAPVTSHAHIDVKTAMNVHLARLCMPFVRPDKGVHTEMEALSGALRILSDRLGRNPRLRSTVRRLLGKQGVLSVRPTVDESRIGRNRSLLRIRQPLHQVQGHRLLAIRQAQKERVLNTVITLDPAQALPKVRAALGKHTHPAHEEVLTEVALQALQYRLLPMLEQDVRLELKERADSEALRFLSQHLRQLLFTPPFGAYPVAGVDVNAKGDWTVAILNAAGEPQGAEIKIETSEKDAAALGAELAGALAPTNTCALAVGHGKGPRAAMQRMRAALKAAGYDATVFIVNEAGLSSYASSEIARGELGDRAVPARMAISLGRRLQDPLSEVLKVDPRHLGLGSEQGLVSKANARRVFTETIESCTAHVGCDVNRASLSFLQHLPGIDRATAQKIVERRKERPFQSREELRAEGLLSESQWTSAIAFLRVMGSSEPLDATSLHPEQYTLVRRLLDSAGTTVEQALGRPGATRGLRKADVDVDEATWRDLMRELSFPGRDPRMRLFVPVLLDPDTDPIRLVKDRVVEGLVSNVASFGTFVDIGLPVDAMVHISEISDRYVRDAREFLSIGQLVRARILDASAPRLSLSLKHVPPREREPRPSFDRGQGGARRGERGERTERGGGGRDTRRGGGRGRPEREEPQPKPNVRAAQSRRDGLAGGHGGGRGGMRPGGKRGPGRGAEGGEREERVRLDSIETLRKPAFSPFASFFKTKQPEKTPEKES